MKFKFLIFFLLLFFFQNISSAIDYGNYLAGRYALSKKDYENIRLKQNIILGTDGALWAIHDIDNEQYITSNVQYFDICKSYIWSTYGSQATLLDTMTAQTWVYDDEDGIPGNKIYEVNCDDEWVWFLTNRGIAFYNWSRYHNKKN